MNTIQQNLILGALVADAATVGVHWIYDQHRIIDVVAGKPEFHPPTKKEYEGVTSFFAHGNSSVGDLSNYGEQAWVMLKALASNNGHYSKESYQDAFRAHFSYGGEYVGYIDRPTERSLRVVVTVISSKVISSA